MVFKLERSTRLSLAIGISFCFFLAEISIGFKTHSIALIADAFHYLNDLLSFIVALVALQISEKWKTHKDLTFGWQRAQLLGAFFNGVFLLALGLSIFLQSIERFISLQRMEDPILVLMVGCIGLGLNIITVTFLHEHDHGHDHHHHAPGEVPLAVPPLEETVADDEILSVTEMTNVTDGHREHRHLHQAPTQRSHHDLGMAGVLLHVLGDAINNIGVIIAAAVIWKLKSEGRFYADPAVSMAIAFMIFASALPLVKRSGHILLQSPPSGLDVDDIRHDLEKIPGVMSVHELHVWRLNQQKSLASAHVVLENPSFESFQNQAKIINECFHAYGVHSATIQPEREADGLRRRIPLVDSARASGDGTQDLTPGACQMKCRSVCEKMTCCG